MMLSATQTTTNASGGAKGGGCAATTTVPSSASGDKNYSNQHQIARKKKQLLQQQSATSRRNQSPTAAETDNTGPIPLRRASYAFDHRHGMHGAKACSTPPGYHHQQNPHINGLAHHHHHHHQQPQSAPPVPMTHNHHQDSSDCGSSSGLGGMGTPVKGEGVLGSASCSTSSNNSVAADCSHDSRDSGGPVSAEDGGGGGSSLNGHRSLVATATLTPSMVSSQHTTTISPPATQCIVAPLTPLCQQQLFQQPYGALPMAPQHHNHHPQLAPIPLHHVVQHHHPPQQHLPQQPPQQLNAQQLGAMHAAGTPPAPSTNGGASPAPAPMQKAGPPMQPQPLPPPTGRALYTMTCETTALASVSTAALTAGYHVTLDPCASAPPIAGAMPPLAPPPGFQQAALPGDQQQQNNVPSAEGNAGDGSPAESNNNEGAGGGDQQQQGVPPTATTINLPPGVPPEIAAAINGGHDLFVHIHPGDAIALAVGNDIQHIHGPATIRMVSQCPPMSAIPMNVPQGHVVQQLLDRQGYLSHIIMSQEMGPPRQGAPMIPAVASQHQQQEMQVPTTSMSAPPQPLQRASAQHQSQQNSLQPQALLQAPRASPLGKQRNASSPHSSIASPTTQNLEQYQQHNHQAPAPLLKWSPPQGGGGHQGGGGGRSHQYRGQPGAASASGAPYLEQHHVHFQPRQSPAGFYVQGPTIGGHENQGYEPPPAALYGHPQVQAVHHGSATVTFDPSMPTTMSAAAGGTIEEDEKERLKDALASLQPPMLARVGERDAEVVWQELDTSEAAASGGPFPQIDASEFVYQLILYDAASQSQACYKCEAGTNLLHLQRLRPGTEYMISIQAELPERGISGHPSAYASFRTACARPDPPPMPKLTAQKPTSISLQWRCPNCNGAPVTGYCLQMAKGKSAPFESVYEGQHDHAVVGGLDTAGGLYRFRVYARNELGQSDASPVLNVYPESRYHGGGGGGGHYGAVQQRGGAGSMASSSSSAQHHQQQQLLQHRPPQPPSVYSFGARTVKLSWSAQHADFASLVLEMSDFAVRQFAPVAAECYANSGTFAHITGLQSNREYRFRLAAVMQASGGAEQPLVLHSEPVTVRTRGEPRDTAPRRDYDSHQHNNFVASQQQQHDVTASEMQQRTSNNNNAPALQQRPTLAATKKTQQVTQQQPSQKKTQQQQQKTQRDSVEDNIDASGTPTQQTVKPVKKPPACATPKFGALTAESAHVAWRLVTDPGSPKQSPANDAFLFELQRVDQQQPLMVYSGSEAEYEYRGLKPVEHLQLRVRAVLLDTEGRRLEGEWSPVGSACTLSAPPSAPRNLRLANADASAGDDTNEEEEASSGKKQQQQHCVTLCWDPPAHLNGACVREYSVYAARYATGADPDSDAPLEEERMLGTASECRFTTPRLQPAHLYRFNVSAHNEAGASKREECTLRWESAPGVPDAPRDARAQALSTTELQLGWTEPCSSNGAPIHAYHVNCFKLYGAARATHASESTRQRQLVSQQIAPGSQRLLLVQSLEAETDYELVIQAENAVGKSARECVRCATLAEPPAPPVLALAQAQAKELKLKWSTDGDVPAGANHYYYLERENENGTYSPVYEGELRTARVKGLREQSTHHFRIRAAVSKGLMLGPWSGRYSFQTTRAPPPAPKQAPSVTEQAQEHFQFEWNPVRCRSEAVPGDESPANTEGEQRIEYIYRLQIAPKVASTVKEKSTVEVWKTVFEENATQTPPIYVPNTSQQTRQARLFLIQRWVDADGHTIDESISAPSPIAVFSSQKTPNESPKKRNVQGASSSKSGPLRKSTNPYPLPKEGKVSLGKKIRRMASWLRKTVPEKDCALIVLAVFVMLAFGIAILLNNFYLN